MGKLISEFVVLWRDLLKKNLNRRGFCPSYAAAAVTRPLAGKAVRLRFRLRDADVYSFQFIPYVPEPARHEIPK